MAGRKSTPQLRGELIDDSIELTLAELCRACRLPAERIIELVDEGIVEPSGRNPARWRFRGFCILRVCRAQRLQRDLGVNTPGVALAIELLEEVDELRRRLQQLEAGAS